SPPSRRSASCPPRCRRRRGRRCAPEQAVGLVGEPTRLTELERHPEPRRGLGGGGARAGGRLPGIWPGLGEDRGGVCGGAWGGVAGAPSASATAGCTTWPRQMLTPFASAGFARVAAATPRVASSSAYGSVAFVSANVEVRGTSAGMLATP